MDQKTAVIGATTNPARYAYIAARMLRDYQIPIVPLGIKKGEVAGETILNIREHPPVDGIHTITLYLGPRHQKEYYDYLLGLKPKRIIFNPGTENEEFIQKAEQQGIKVEEACTLVLLRTGQY